MSDSHEPSYYEIALTNRQVLFAFVILLVCLLATFVAGVWVGRSGEVQAAAPPAGERLAESAAPADAGKNGEAPEKLSFFGDDHPATAPPQEVAAPARPAPAAAGDRHHAARGSDAGDAAGRRGGAAGAERAAAGGRRSHSGRRAAAPPPAHRRGPRLPRRPPRPPAAWSSRSSRRATRIRPRRW